MEKFYAKLRSFLLKNESANNLMLGALKAGLDKKARSLTRFPL